MRRLVRTCLAVALLAGTLAASGPAAAALPPAGRLIDASFVSRALGGERERMRVYVPAQCTRARPCAVLYLLHGFGGDWTYWTEGGRVVEFATRPTALPLVLVMPDGAPAGFWTDWFNEGAYGPPRYETMFVRELMPFVERTFPVRRGRAWTGIDGASLGGFGSWKLALKHPHRFASVGSISGALNILVAPGVPLTVAAPVAIPWTGDALPRPPTPPAPDIPGFPFANPFRTFGDPVTNEWYYRTNNPLDLAPNAGGLAMRQLVFDAEPAAEPPSGGTFGDVGLEAAVLPMNLEMDARLTALGYDHEFELARGNHSWESRYPFIREQLEFHARALNGRSRPPASFTYRSAESSFEAYGWRFEVDRPVHEFLEVEFRAGGFTARGGGGLTRVTSPPVPRACRSFRFDYEGSWHSGGGGGDAGEVGRRLRFRVNLGESSPVDHHDATHALGPWQPTTSVEVRVGGPGCAVRGPGWASGPMTEPGG